MTVRSVMTLMVLLLSAGLALAAPEPTPSTPSSLPFKVGAAAVKITPSMKKTVFLAGFDNDRKATGIHDDLYARAIVIERGSTRVGLVALDLIGLSNNRIEKIKKHVKGIPADNLILACTHVHSGPDTLGLWGPSIFSSGVDQQYMKFLAEQVEAAVEQAISVMKPARLRAGVAEAPNGIAHNSRELIQDKDVHVLHFTGEDGKAVATLVHFGCHPETVMGENNQITADFPGPALKLVETQTGAPAAFFNGALGGMVTPTVGAPRSFAEVQRVGEAVGQVALTALAAAKPVEGDTLSVRRKRVRIPGTNERLRLGVQFGVIDAKMEGGDAITEMARIDIGQVRMLTIPGELLPKPALALKPEIGGPAPLILSLGEDELGYIVDPSDWEKKVYKYEKSMSVGKETWPRVYAAAKELLAAEGSVNLRDSEKRKLRR